MPYALEGIETATLPPGDTFRASAGTRGFGHTAADTEDKVDLRDLQEAAALVSRIMLRLGIRDSLPMRRRSAIEVKAMLDAYALYEVMDVQKGIPPFLQGRT
jgi:Zn-dependent M28 family amino/carboxypeptidase